MTDKLSRYCTTQGHCSRYGDWAVDCHDQLIVVKIPSSNNRNLLGPNELNGLPSSYVASIGGSIPVVKPAGA
jgi:hypothetical protein